MHLRAESLVLPIFSLFRVVLPIKGVCRFDLIYCGRFPPVGLFDNAGFSQAIDFLTSKFFLVSVSVGGCCPWAWVGGLYQVLFCSLYNSVGCALFFLSHYFKSIRWCSLAGTSAFSFGQCRVQWFQLQISFFDHLDLYS